MSSKPWYRQKKFWALGAAMVLVVGVGGLYLWKLVPSASYRELMREVQRERIKESPDGDPATLIEESVPDVGMATDELVPNPGDMYRWGHQFGQFDFLVNYIAPNQASFTTGTIHKKVSETARILALNRQLFFQPEDFSLEKLDRWADAYLDGNIDSNDLVSNAVSWCIVRAEWSGNGERALRLLDRFIEETLEDPSFYGLIPQKSPSVGHHLPGLMLVLNYCGIENPLLWDRIGEALEEAESRQGDYVKSLNETLLLESDSLIRSLEESPPGFNDEILPLFMDGAIASVIQSVYKPLYIQKVKSFVGNIYRGNFDKALENLEAINALSEKMYWNSNPWIDKFLGFHFSTLGSRGAQLAWLKLYRENRQSLMGVTPREYAVSVYTYLREGTIEKGVELFELKSFTPIKITYYHSEDYSALFKSTPGSYLSLEDIPEYDTYREIRTSFLKNLSVPVTPGVALIQTKSTSFSDPMIFESLYWGAFSYKNMEEYFILDTPVTVLYGELIVFPDLESIREKLAPGVTTPDPQEDQ